MSNRNTNQELEYFATCPKGFEALLADELSSIGMAHVRPPLFRS
jgi:23S rRNA G2445 N2-methylase RlmL